MEMSSLPSPLALARVPIPASLSLVRADRDGMRAVVVIHLIQKNTSQSKHDISFFLLHPNSVAAGEPSPGFVDDDLQQLNILNVVGVSCYR